MRPSAEGTLPGDYVILYELDTPRQLFLFMAICNSNVEILACAMLNSSLPNMGSEAVQPPWAFSLPLDPPNRQERDWKNVWNMQELAWVAERGVRWRS